MRDLNPRPADYKSAALPTELIQRMWHEKDFLCGNLLCQLKPHEVVYFY